MIEIRNRWTGKTIVEVEAETVGEAIAKLCAEARTKGARADLTGAVLTGAVLTGAVLTGAVLTDADLTGAVLTDADLTGAVLTGAVLTGAVLTGAVLTGAVLTDAVLVRFPAAKEDLFAVLDAAPEQAKAVLEALRAGRVDGTRYHGECSCLLGTIASARGIDVDHIPGLAPDSSRPAEQFFLSIRPGHTPEISPHAALAEVWIEQWMTKRASASSESAS